MLASHFLPSEARRQRINLKSQENSARSILLRHGGSDPPNHPELKSRKKGFSKPGGVGEKGRSCCRVPGLTAL